MSASPLDVNELLALIDPLHTQRDVLPLVTWLAVTERISLRAADIAAAQRLSGRPCGTIDPLIAATALEQGVPLLTRNVQHFEHVAGLEVQN